MGTSSATGAHLEAAPLQRLLTDEEWSQWSDREVARRCAVGHAFVFNMRQGLTVHNGQTRRKYTNSHALLSADLGRQPVGHELLDNPPSPQPFSHELPNDLGARHAPRAGQRVYVLGLIDLHPRHEWHDEPSRPSPTNHRAYRALRHERRLAAERTLASGTPTNLDEPQRGRGNPGSGLQLSTVQMSQ